MREFKFRAWDKRNEVMGQVSRIDFNEAQYPFAAVRFKQHGRTRDEGYHFGQEDGSDNIILLQYTGLKDRNGKEIYEGDVLEQDGLQFQVCFEHGCFCGKPLRHNEIPGALYSIDFHKYKKIGNIYENLELLEGTKCKK